MAKIDCSQAVNFIRESKRMCMREKCNECPASTANNGTGYKCERLLYSCPEVAIEIVQKWSDEHPVKTRLDDLLEKYPKFEVFSETGRPLYKPHLFGYCDDCFSCPNKKVERCWHEPLDGGATGKAVE